MWGLLQPMFTNQPLRIWHVTQNTLGSPHNATAKKGFYLKLRISIPCSPVCTGHKQIFTLLLFGSFAMHRHAKQSDTDSRVIFHCPSYIVRSLTSQITHFPTYQLWYLAILTFQFYVLMFWDLSFPKTMVPEHYLQFPLEHGSMYLKQNLACTYKGPACSCVIVYVKKEQTKDWYRHSNIAVDIHWEVSQPILLLWFFTSSLLFTPQFWFKLQACLLT